MESGKNSSLSKTFASLALAFAIIFIVCVVFKVTMMPKDERYKRTCMQGAASAALDANAAYEEDLSGGPAPRPSLYSSFPWINPEKKPENKLMEKTWNFCNDVLAQEQHSSNLRNTMTSTAVGSHNISAANTLIEHIAKGWGIGNDIEAQKAILSKAVSDWGTHGRDQDVQELLSKYDEALAEPTTAAVASRILSFGRFDTKDICAHSATFIKFKMVKDPASFLKSLKCDAK